jgi:hypothetical protein
MPGSTGCAAGLALTLLGVLLFLYAIAEAVAQGHIGSREAWTPGAEAILVGWFLLLIGPALAFGETPASLKPK